MYLNDRVRTTFAKNPFYFRSTSAWNSLTEDSSVFCFKFVIFCIILNLFCQLISDLIFVFSLAFFER